MLFIAPTVKLIVDGMESLLDGSPDQESQEMKAVPEAGDHKSEIT